MFKLNSPSKPEGGSGQISQKENVISVIKMLAMNFIFCSPVRRLQRKEANIFNATII